MSTTKRAGHLTKWLLVLLVAVVIAGSIGSYFLLSEQQSSISSPEIHQLQSLHLKAPRSSVATGVQAMVEPSTKPLAVLLTAGNELAQRQSGRSCEAIAVTLAKAGSPQSMFALAQRLPDSLARGMFESLVPAEQQVLLPCVASKPTASEIARLERLLVGLEFRLSQDGVHGG